MWQLQREPRTSDERWPGWIVDQRPGPRYTVRRGPGGWDCRQVNDDGLPCVPGAMWRIAYGQLVGRLKRVGIIADPEMVAMDTGNGCPL